MTLEVLEITKSVAGSSNGTLPKFKARLPDLKFNKHDGWVHCKLFSTRHDGKTFAYQFEYGGRLHKSEYSFQAHQLVDLINAARARFIALTKAARMNATVLNSRRNRLPVGKLINLGR